MKQARPLTAVLAAALAAALGLGAAAACFSDRAAPTGPDVGDCRLTLGEDDLGTPHVVVAIRDFAFQPAEVRIRPGTTVIWVNCETDTPVSHTTTSDAGAWGSALLAPEERFSFTFDAAGSFPYHCVPHPSMTGTITVEP